MHGWTYCAVHSKSAAAQSVSFVFLARCVIFVVVTHDTCCSAETESAVGLPLKRLVYCVVLILLCLRECLCRKCLLWIKFLGVAVATDCVLRMEFVRVVVASDTALQCVTLLSRTSSWPWCWLLRHVSAILVV